MASAAERERQRQDLVKDECRSLAECAQECSQDITAISKQILEFMLERSRRSGKERLVELLTLFEQKLERMKRLVQISPEYRERATLMEELQACVENRDEIIQSYADNLRGAEQVLTKGLFQANKKLKTMAESDANPVYSEDVIKFAHQISKTYSVAAPAYWQMGDPSRPFPTEHELRQSSIDSAKNTVPPMTVPSAATRSSQLAPPSSRLGSSPANYSASPRTAASQQPIPSPRARGHAGAAVTPSSMGGGGQWKGMETSPFTHGKKSDPSPKRSAMKQKEKNENQDQLMSSDSSSSSSSEEEGN